MSECPYCYKIMHVLYPAPQHFLCQQERVRRENANICIKCNEKLNNKGNPCKRCGPNGLYKGYPG